MIGENSGYFIFVDYSINTQSSTDYISKTLQDEFECSTAGRKV